MASSKIGADQMVVVKSAPCRGSAGRALRQSIVVGRQQSGVSERAGFLLGKNETPNNRAADGRDDIAPSLCGILDHGHTRRGRGGSDHLPLSEQMDQQNGWCVRSSRPPGPHRY